MQTTEDMTSRTFKQIAQRQPGRTLPRYIASLVLLLLGLSSGMTSLIASAQTPPTPGPDPNQPLIIVATPNDSLIANDFTPWATCYYRHPSTLCYTYIYESKAKWKSPEVSDSSLDQSDPKTCLIWLFYCSLPYDYIHLLTSNSVTLTKPSVSSLANGITFLLRIKTNARTSATQEGTMISMPGAFAINTIGPRWGLHTYPTADPNGYDQTPWEPFDHAGNVNMFEEVYYTFSPIGRLIIDKLTAYNKNGSVHYIWEESANDDGWPFTISAPSSGIESGSLAPITNLVLGGNGSPSGVDSFKELIVFKQGLTKEQIINQENFYHPAGSNLTTAMSPCNTGNWVNSGTVITPCGSGGNQNPVPAPSTNVSGFSETTDSYAPLNFSFTETSQGQGTFTFQPPSKTPPLSEIQNPQDPAPWSPFYPLTPTRYEAYLLFDGGTEGPKECVGTLSGPGSSQIAGYDGKIIQAGVQAIYPDQALDVGPWQKDNNNNPLNLTTSSYAPSNPPNFTNQNYFIPANWVCQIFVTQ